MPPNYLILKLVLAPIIIAAATLVARRWGEAIGGLMVGLPLTSGPVSIFFAVEQGQKFAANAALGAMLGLIPVAVFCTAYASVSKRLSWHLSAVVSIPLYLVSVWVMSLASPGLGSTSLLVPAALGAALLLVGKREAAGMPIAPPWWDLPLRMVVATTLLLLITSAAGMLGPKWSGLLSPFPVFTFVMATFSHSQGGSSATRRFMRGVLTGLFAYLAFFLVVALLIERTSPLLVYLLATAAALGVNGVSLISLIRKSHTMAKI